VYGFNNLSRTALPGHAAENLFAIQNAIQHLNNRQQLDRVCFLARLLGEGAPVVVSWETALLSFGFPKSTLGSKTGLSNTAHSE